MRYSLVFALLLLAVPAAASNWQYIGTSTDGKVFSIDMESVRASGNGKLVWLKKKPSADANMEFNELWEYSCEGRCRIVNDSFDRPGDGSWIFIPPDTIWSSIEKRICQ